MSSVLDYQLSRHEHSWRRCFWLRLGHLLPSLFLVDVVLFYFLSVLRLFSQYCSNSIPSLSLSIKKRISLIVYHEIFWQKLQIWFVTFFFYFYYCIIQVFFQFDFLISVWFFLEKLASYNKHRDFKRNKHKQSVSSSLQRKRMSQLSMYSFFGCEILLFGWLGFFWNSCSSPTMCVCMCLRYWKQEKFRAGSFLGIISGFW